VLASHIQQLIPQSATYEGQYHTGFMHNSSINCSITRHVCVTANMVSVSELHMRRLDTCVTWPCPCVLNTQVHVGMVHTCGRDVTFNITQVALSTCLQCGTSCFGLFAVPPFRACQPHCQPFRAQTPSFLPPLWFPIAW
jgi:hypothetical protein